MSRILIIDDEISIRRMLAVILEGAGYKVFSAEDASHGLQEIALGKPDLVILDLGLPDADGVNVLRRLREWSAVPVMILSARPDSAEKVRALDLGADDYLTKPFDSHELLARVRVMLRRVPGEAQESMVSLGDLGVDFANHVASVGGKAVALTPIEFSLLAQLARHPGRILTHTHLLNAVWGSKAADQGHYLRVHFTHLRRKLREAGLDSGIIQNEPGMGYRLRH